MTNLNRWEALMDTTLVSSGWTITFTDNGGSFDVTPVGTAFLSSPGGGLLATIALAATVASSGGLTYSASLDSDTGKVTISASPLLNFSMDFTNGSVIQAALGFTTNPSGASSHTGLSASEAVWLPHQGYQGEYGIGDEGWTESDDVATISPDGLIKRIGYNKRIVNQFQYTGVLERFTRTAAETITNEAVQTFWDNTVYGEASWASRGTPWRLYWDSTDDGTYATYVVTNVDTFRPTKKVADWTGVYQFTFNVGKYVT